MGWEQDDERPPGGDGDPDPAPDLDDVDLDRELAELLAAEDAWDVGSGAGFVHRPWTPEGSIERLDAFVLGTGRAREWRRTVAKVVVWAMVAPAVAIVLNVLARVLG